MNRGFTFINSFLLVLFLLILIFIGMVGIGSGPHMVMVLCIAVVATIAHFQGFAWETMETFMAQGVTQCVKAIFILGFIGVLIAVWMMSGTVPMLFYLGLKTISPEWFLLTSLFVTIIVSSFTGSSLTTAGTVGVALMGIANGFGVDPSQAAGAVICGACFGDKLSPLSDTTNFAPGIVGVDLFTHIKNLLWTTVPALVLTVLYFSVLGSSVSLEDFTLIKQASLALEQSFELSYACLLSPLVVLTLAFLRFPTLPILGVGVLTGLLTAGFIQGQWNISLWFEVLQNGYQLQTDSGVVNDIVSRGGLMSMMFSVSLVILALAFGGLLQGLGVISSLMDGVKKHLKNPGPIVASTAAASCGINFLTGEQYLSILLPGQAFKPLYNHPRLSPQVLSRTLEDAGTLINPLVPWGVCGAFFTNALGVSVLDYAPYAVFLYLSPAFSILFAYLGIGLGSTSTYSDARDVPHQRAYP
ncbi:MAG: Na+/H+ antiporter NhaC [Oligoflexales bacterium]